MKYILIWFFVFLLQLQVFSKESEVTEDSFSTKELFKRKKEELPAKITKEEEEFILSKLTSDDFSTQREYMQIVGVLRINTLRIRETLLEMMENPENEKLQEFFHKRYGTVSGGARSALEKIYLIPYKHGIELQQRIDLKKQLNKHPDFEGRFTEELAKQSDRKPLVRPESPLENSPSTQSTEQSENGAKSTEENPSSFSWLYWILGLLILGGIVAVVLNDGKSSPSS